MKADTREAHETSGNLDFGSMRDFEQAAAIQTKLVLCDRVTLKPAVMGSRSGANDLK